MADRLVTPLFRVALFHAVAGLALLSGCATHNIVAYPTQVTGILPPHRASLSPDYAPASITRIAVLPLSARATADAWWQDNLARTLAGEIATRHPQWSVAPSEDMTRLLDDPGHASGLHSLEADYQASESEGRPLQISPAGQAFLEALRDSAGVDGVLIGSYTLSTQTKPIEDRYGRVVSYETGPVCDVRVSLIHAPSKRAWWAAESARSGARERVVREISQTIATHIGKGDLRQR